MSVIISFLLLAGVGYQFPFAHNNVCRGYGDWNAWVEFHTGIDFRCDSTEMAMNPYWDELAPAYVLQSGENPRTHDWVVFMSTDPDDETGWAYEHMRREDGDLHQYAVGKIFNDSVGRCVDNPENGRHLHMIWMDVYNWEHAVDTIPQPGYLNPFDLLPVPAGYDRALFDKVSIAWSLGYPDSTRGIWFVKDGYDGPFYDSLFAFQSRVWGPVDAVVKAISAYQGNPMNDSCGIRSISSSILRCNFSSGSWNSIPEYSDRTLFDMTGYLPDGNVGCPPEFEHVFFDRALAKHYDNNYIVTNCGCDTVSDTCLSNVWISGYDRQADWQARQYCRGAWDTRLCNPAVPGSPSDHMARDNSQALFPDGEYLFEVSVESQGSRHRATAFLPTTDLSDPTILNASSIIVDNYAPYVDSVVVFVPGADPEILYTGGWETDATGNRTFNCTRLGYSFDRAFQIAVHYSEPVESDTNDVMFSIVSGRDVLWRSTYPASRRFIPIPASDGIGVASASETGFWQSYRMMDPTQYPQGYFGRIVLGFGPSRISINPEGPFDLSGNPLDRDPSTIAVRNPVTGNWEGYEKGQDLTHWWGDAGNYCHVGFDHSAIGRVLTDGDDSDLKFEVPLLPTLIDGVLIGDCSFVNGFWMFVQDPYSERLFCSVVRPNGTGMGVCSIYPIPHLYRVDYGFASADSHSCVDLRLSTDRYQWFCVMNAYLCDVPFSDIHATGIVVCVDCQHGVVMSAQIFSGYGNPVHPVHALFGPCFGSIRLVSDTTDTVEVSYMLPREVYPEYDTFYVYLTPPSKASLSGSQVQSFNDECDHLNIPAVVEETPPSLTLERNPSGKEIVMILSSIPEEEMDVVLIDLAGRTVLRRTALEIRDERCRIILDTSGLPNGVYLLRASGDRTTLQRQVVILR